MELYHDDETLDGDTTTYRSSRHFDVLNESIAFELNPANDKYAYRAIFDNRRNAYGQGLVLLNNTSHDEQTSDPWDAAIRSAVTGLMDGATMIFPDRNWAYKTLLWLSALRIQLR